MSRNGPIGLAAMRPPARRPLGDDAFVAPPTGQPVQHWPPQYPDPQGAHHQQPTHPPQFAHGQQPSYPPQPGYAQPQRGQGQHPSYAQAQPHGQQPGQGYYFPQAAAEPAPGPGYASQASGKQLPYEGPSQAAPNFSAQMQQAQTTPRWSQQPDPRGYDLGHYMPASAPGYQPEMQSTSHFQQAPDAVPLQHQGEFDPAGRQHDPAHHGYGETDADFDEILAEEEEPRRGRRGMMIAAALVGAIGLGGAMAYTYKTFVASSGVRAPLIKVGDQGPNKVKPAVADGKSFADTDKKLLNRLGEDSNRAGHVGGPPPAAEASDDRASDDPNAPKRVRIIPINPGAPAAGAAPVTTASAPPRAAAPPMVAVPGVTLENLGPPAATRAALPVPQAQPHAAPPARAPASVQVPVKVVASAKAEPPPAAAEPVAKKAAPAAKRVVEKMPVPKTKTAAAAPVAISGSGYVAVLSSKKSRMDALKAFADMQQKYGDVLSARTPDVQEANLGNKGIWYRAVVGPPGSREAASGLCGQLKTAGFNGCWVTAY